MQQIRTLPSRTPGHICCHEVDRRIGRRKEPEGDLGDLAQGTDGGDSGFPRHPRSHDGKQKGKRKGDPSQPEGNIKKPTLGDQTEHE